MLDFLKLIASRLLIILVCGVILVVCVNEIANRGWLDNNPLKTTPLAALTWQNLVGGPKKWQTLGWFNLKPMQQNASDALTKLPAPILQLAGQSSPSAATSATLSASQAAVPTNPAAAQTSTPSAEVVKIYWQKFQQELGQIWERTKTAAGATQVFIRTQLFAPTPKTTGSTSATVAPLEQRALEYAKYMYCKETVSNYEKLNPEVVAPNATK